VLTTILVRKQQIQQSHLSEHVTVFNAWQMTVAGAHLPGTPRFNYMAQLITGQKQGLLMLYDEVQSQATMISLNNIYRMLTGVMIIALLLTVLLPRPTGRAPAGGH
jgi:hypothetical protein